jgi:hypothetical protein|tara:strand:- start:1141 stop:1530 length:390 start_codon:yes stop_codon:yes gene_type:complete
MMSKFYDIDLPFGIKYEGTLSELLTAKTNKLIEVKTERDIWKETGNIYVEFIWRETFSGIVTTKADWWATILTLNDEVQGIILLPTKLMRDKVKKLIKEGIAQYPVSGGDDNDSQGALVPIKELMNYEG